MRRPPDVSSNEAPAGAEPVRWTAGGATDPHEARAGTLLRQATERRPLGDAELEVIRTRLMPEGPQRRGGTRILLWQVAVGLALMLSGGALVVAATHLFRRTPERQAARLDIAAPPAPGRVVHRHSRTPASPSAETSEISNEGPPEAPSAVAAPSAPDLGPPAAAPGVSSRRPAIVTSVTRRPVAASAATADTAQPSALAREARLLAEGLHELRQSDDPAAALALFDQRDAEFSGSGALNAEANAARIEALLRLHRDDQALALLDATPLGGRGVERESLMARAELRARANRCGEAEADFDALLTHAGARVADDPVTERALYGRAACRAQRRDVAGARADLNSYLARFPNGRFLAAARAALLPRHDDSPKP